MNNELFICNECNRKHHTKEEPITCDCGSDNFGIQEREPKNKRLTLYWADKLRTLQEEHPENPLKALYLFEAWAEEEENKFNERWYYEG